MGEIIKAYQLRLSETENLMKPIIYCTSLSAVDESAVSVSIALAREFQKQSSDMMRTMRLESNLLNVLQALGENPIIKDIDVLFNPAYQTDVLKALLHVCRKKQFCIVWPGRYENGRLYYAEEGYLDYKSYSIEDYDVTVIV